MMSLQVLLLVLVLVTLVLYAIHSKLQTTRREVKKVEEVKTHISPICNPKDIEDYKSFLSPQALDVINKIKYIQENPTQINWEEWEEVDDDSYNDTSDGSCPCCSNYSCAGILCNDCFTLDNYDNCVSFGKESFALYEEEEKKDEDNILDDMYIVQEKLSKTKKSIKKFKRKKTKFKRRQIRKLSFRELHIKTFG